MKSLLIKPTVNTLKYPHPSQISIKNWPQNLMNTHNQNRHLEGLRRTQAKENKSLEDKIANSEETAAHYQNTSKILNDTFLKSELKLAEAVNADTGIQMQGFKKTRA